MHSIHPGSRPHVAEEGEFSTASSRCPVLHYFPIRGRAEPIRLVLAYQRVCWFEPEVEPILQIMRQELDGYPFRQLPRFIDEVHGDIDLVQSGAILRHLARKYGMYGSSLEEQARVDMVIEGCQDIRTKLRVVWVDEELRAEAKQLYVDTVLLTEADLKKSKVPGPGLASLENLVSDPVVQEKGWIASDTPTIADIVVFDLVDVHLVQFSGVIQQRFPHLVKLHAAVAALEGIKEYLVSDNRHSAIFASDWQPARLGNSPGEA